MRRICAAVYATPEPECEIYQFLSSYGNMGKVNCRSSKTRAEMVPWHRKLGVLMEQ
jgi:hypothetical protein